MGPIAATAVTAADQVLVVEDVPEVAEWLEQMLLATLSPSQVTVAPNFAIACQALQQPYDLVLMDLGLPDGDGTDLIVSLKHRYPDCACIVTTIFDDADHLFRALRAGADGYLLKDETEAEFQEQLRGILQGRPPLSSSVATRMLEFFRPSRPVETGLTTREEEMLVLIARGYSVRRAADMLGISYHTGAGYLKVVYQKLQVNSRAEATLKAIDMGLISGQA